MEYIVAFHARRESQLVYQRTEYPFNFEGSFSFWFQLLIGVSCLKVFHLKLYQLTCFERCKVPSNLSFHPQLSELECGLCFFIRT